MPEITINIAAGRSNEIKKALMLDITQAVVKHCNVSADVVVVQINETPLTDKMKGGITFAERATK